MAKYKLCFSIAEQFGAKIELEARPGIPYEEAAAAIDKNKLSELLCLPALGYSADDIKVITPEQYEAEYGGAE